MHSVLRIGGILRIFHPPGIDIVGIDERKVGRPDRSNRGIGNRDCICSRHSVKDRGQFDPMIFVGRQMIEPEGLPGDARRPDPPLRWFLAVIMIDGIGGRRVAIIILRPVSIDPVVAGGGDARLPGGHIPRGSSRCQGNGICRDRAVWNDLGPKKNGGRTKPYPFSIAALIKVFLPS